MACRPGWSVLLLLGCGPVISGDDTGDGSASDSSTGSDTGTSASTSTTAPSGTVGTTASTTATTSTTPEPIGCDANYVTGCQSYCAAAITCDPSAGVYEECVNELCSADLAAASAECQQLFCEGLTCYGVLDCATFEAGSLECEALMDKADEVCGGGDVACVISDTSDGFCEYLCDGEVERRMECGGGTGACRCYEDELPTGECPFESECSDPAAIEDHASFCCGW